MEKSVNAKLSARFPAIHNCNYWKRHRDGDVLGGEVWEAIVDVFECGCDDEDVLDALDSLEHVLAQRAESDSEEIVKACQRAEEEVQAEWRSMHITAGRWSWSR